MHKNKLFLLVLVLVFFIPTHAQNKGTIGFSFSAFNNNQMLRTAESDYNHMMQGRGFLSFSGNYWYPVNDWLEVETGLTYTIRDFEHKFFGENPDVIDNRKVFHMVNLPVGFRATFLKYCFVNTGILVDLLEEPGIGSYFGGGLKIESPLGVGMFINPYVKMHSIMPIDFNSKANRIVDAGIQVGVSYSFDNMISKRK